MLVKLTPFFHNCSDKPTLQVALLGFAWALFSGPSNAAITCTQSNTVNLGPAIDVLAGVPAATPGSINLTCTHSELGRVARVCLHFERGTASTALGGLYSPRLIATNNGTGPEKAGFNLNHNGNSTGDMGADPSSPTTGIWGTYFDASGPQTPYVSQQRTYSSAGFTLNLQIPFSAALLDSSGGSAVNMIAPGVYKTSLSGGHARLQIPVVTAGLNIDNRCGIGVAIQYGNDNVPVIFDVQATVIPSCKIKGAIADINFGTHPGTATNLQGNTSMTVQCTRTTPYYIGLRPSNGNANGAGLMYGQAPLTAADTVAYQLRSASGMTGTIWGNTATSTAVGNGVAGTGTGNDQTINIYATVTSTSAATGNYQDTVTVTVNY